VEKLMADALRDPTLAIAYRRTDGEGYVDAHGEPVHLPLAGERRSVAEIGRDSAPVAAVVFDARLADQERFVAAAGEAASLWLQRNQLQAELSASLRELAVSRRRLLDAAVVERQRIQRDLHDGAQQHLVGMRVKVGLALRSLDHEPARGREMLVELQDELEQALIELRELANGVYPSMLEEHGLERALRGACRTMPNEIRVEVDCIRRYSRDVEGAVYFTCLEALQNVVKHAGPDVPAAVRLRQRGDRLCFEVVDAGPGLEGSAVRRGRGLINMADRIEAVGGRLRVMSMLSGGTAVDGAVPIVASVADAGPGERRRG
jgi:signal transduction histidine kinase